MHRNFIFLIVLFSLSFLHLGYCQSGYGDEEPAAQTANNAPSAAPISSQVEPSSPKLDPAKTLKKDLPAEPADYGIASLATEAEANCGFSDILFVVDSTGSVHNVYELQRSYILQLAEQLTIGAEEQHVGLVLYSSKDRQEIVVGLDAVLSKEAFLKIIKYLPYHGGITATGAALSLAHKALEKRRTDKKTLVIVLTDGFSYDNTKPASDALNSLPNVVVVAAGDTDHFIQQVLEEIAGDPSRVLLGEENKPKVMAMLKC